jgi:hypothetical protein
MLKEHAIRHVRNRALCYLRHLFMLRMCMIGEHA